MTGRLLAAALSLLLSGATLLAQPEPQGEFRPLSEVPHAEQLPGGVMVIAAYSFIWVVLLLYVWSIWRRLGKVEAEMKSLERRTGQRDATR